MVLKLIIQRRFNHPLRGGQIGSECPATLDRNRWPSCSGIGGHIGSESVARMPRNMHRDQCHGHETRSILFLKEEFLLQSPSAYAKAQAGELNIGSRSKRCMQTKLALRNYSERGSPDWIKSKFSLRSLRLCRETWFWKGRRSIQKPNEIN
jgi:hypothetical protein